MIAVSSSTRDRFNRFSAILGAIEERKMSQEDTLIWLMDRYEMEFQRHVAVRRVPA